jgi:hypothetical protein
MHSCLRSTIRRTRRLLVRRIIRRVARTIICQRRKNSSEPRRRPDPLHALNTILDAYLTYNQRVRRVIGGWNLRAAMRHIRSLNTIVTHVEAKFPELHKKITPKTV